MELVDAGGARRDGKIGIDGLQERARLSNLHRGVIKNSRDAAAGKVGGREGLAERRISRYAKERRDARAASRRHDYRERSRSTDRSISPYEGRSAIRNTYDTAVVRSSGEREICGRSAAIS